MDTAWRRRSIVMAALLAGGLWALWLAVNRSAPVLDVGFWFEPVTFASIELGGAITPRDIEAVERTARAEIAQAFAGLRFTLSASRTARFRVRVVQTLRDPRFRAPLEVAGSTAVVGGLGGHSAVSFQFLASGAVARAPVGADRATILAAIGRGVGRTAVHELAHQLLPATRIHEAGVDTYEFESAARNQQYFGPIRWGPAWPLLARRFGERDDGGARSTARPRPQPS